MKVLWGFSISVFPEHQQPISLPVRNIIETAFNALKSSTTEPGFYRKQCWEAFCTTLGPRLFTIDLRVMEHKVFFTELLALCKQDDANLQKLPCYKNVTNLVPLRQSALRALAACHYMPECRDKIFTVLYKSLQSTITEIAETSFECMRSFIAGFQMDMEMVHQVGYGGTLGH